MEKDKGKNEVGGCEGGDRMEEEKTEGEEKRTEAQREKGRDTHGMAETQRECQRQRKTGCEQKVPGEW